GVGNQVQTMWNNSDLLAKAWKSAGFLSKTELVPDMYKAKPENCLIALDVANRTGMSPLAVMQNLYVVKGKPSWSGQMCIALVDGCGRFVDDLEFVFVGELGTMSHGCYAKAVKKSNNNMCVSDIITMQMAKDEGWSDKPGSKWKTMPIQMMMYRAGAFFARVHCPDILIGLPLADEVKDTFGYDTQEKQKVVIKMEDID
ncbi:MAG: hypothetical protein RR405_05800, partial [Clostridia bacterium]